jgi:Fe2+ or Zn2+ uptake regulation protein
MLPVLADEYGFQHQQHRVEIYGICQDCSRRDVAGLTAE